MNTERLCGYWDGVKGKLRQRFPELTEADLVWQPGEEEQLLRHLQERTGQTREQLEFFLEVEGGCCEPAGSAARLAGAGRSRVEAGSFGAMPFFTPPRWPAGYALRRDRDGA